jgi:hypothetical protein
LKVMGVPMQEVLLAAYALLDGVDAARSAARGEIGAAMISGGSAVGTGMIAARAIAASRAVAAFRSAAVLRAAAVLKAARWPTPVGFAITVVTTVGQFIYDGVKDAHRYEAASKISLLAAGFKEAAAAKFCRQAGYLSAVAGKAQMSFLEEFARYRGMTMVALRDWINNDLTPDQVSKLSDHVLEAIRPRTQWAGAAIQKVHGAAAFSMREFEEQLVRDKVLKPAQVIPERPLEYR